MQRRVWALVAATSVVFSLLPAAPAAAYIEWTPRTRPAIDFARDRSGSVSFAVVDTHGRISGYRGRTKVPAASVIKVMFMVAYLRMPSVRDRDLATAIATCCGR